MERANPTLGGIDRQYSLTLNQPLWQNSFGRQIRLERDRALHSYESEQGSYSSSRLITCETGLKLYFAAFSAQEAERDYALILNSAEKALEIAKSAHAKRLVRPIDYLAAQADFLRIQSLKLQADQELSHSLSALTSYMAPGASTAPILHDPTPLLREIPPQDPKWSEHPAAIAALKEVAASDLAIRKAKDQARSRLDMILQAGQLEGRIESGADLLDYDENFYKVGIQWTLPLGDTRTTAEIQRKKAEHAAALAKQSSAERQWQEDLEQQRINRATRAEQLRLSERKIALYDQQLKEAFRLLRAGKLEFNDFIRYQDTLLNERITRHRLRSQMWEAWSRWQLLSHRPQALCLEGGV